MTRDLIRLARTVRDRDRAFADVLRQFAARDAWLHDRLLELHVRVKALDGITPTNVPPWPTITIPPALVGLLDEEG